MALSCSSICFSKARMESTLISRTIAVRGIAPRVMECLGDPSTCIDGDVRSRFAEVGNGVRKRGGEN